MFKYIRQVKEEAQKKYGGGGTIVVSTGKSPTKDDLDQIYKNFTTKFDDGASYNPTAPPDPTDEDAYREYAKSHGIAGPTFDEEKGGYSQTFTSPPEEEKEDQPKEKDFQDDEDGEKEEYQVDIDALNEDEINMNDEAGRAGGNPLFSAIDSKVIIAVGIALFLIIALK